MIWYVFHLIATIFQIQNYYDQCTNYKSNIIKYHEMKKYVGLRKDSSLLCETIRIKPLTSYYHTRIDVTMSLQWC